MTNAAAGSSAPTNDRSQLRGKRVIFLFATTNMGGAERQGLLFARYLRDHHGAIPEIWVLAWGEPSPGPLSYASEESGIPCRIIAWYPWKGSRTTIARELLRLAWMLRAAKPDILQPYTIIPSVAVGVIWKLTGAKVCIWQQRDEGRGAFGTSVERLATRLTPLFISNSTPGIDFLTQTLGVAPSKIRLIRNGVALAPAMESRQAWRERLGLEENQLAACMVAHIHQYKDHPTLLKAWRLLLDQWQAPTPKPVLLLAGRLDDRATPVVKALATELNLDAYVQFLGTVKDIAGVLSAADLGVFSSRTEGTPNGVLECMASRLAVVGTDIPGIRDALGPENDSFLIPPGDAERFAQRVLELLRDPAEREKAGRMNRQRLESEFSVEQMCEKTIDGILSVWNRNKGDQ